MGPQASSVQRWITRHRTSGYRATGIAALLGMALCFAPQCIRAQDTQVASTSALPDAPPPSTQQPSSSGTATPTGPVVTTNEKYIQPGVIAPPLTAGNKIGQTLRDLYTPQSFAGFIIAAAYSHGVNGQPNYGTDRGAFGQRLGASAIRDTSQNVLANAVFAPLLHQDPRYYIEGDRYSIGHRLGYALSRALFTRKDDGHTTVNTSLIFGYAAAAALTQTYYPPGNRDAKDSARTFGASIGGAAASFAFHEFLDDALTLTHLRKNRQP